MTQTGPVERRHSVKFYATEASLFATVGQFIAAGLHAGHPAIIIAAQAHRDGILNQLTERDIAVPTARREGALVVLEAEEVLPLLLVRGKPNEDLFDAHVGRLVEQSLRGRGHVIARAYGELVDLLWRAGETDSAITLEMFWNKLALKHRFSLLCGYSMGHFYKDAGQLDEIVSQHTHLEWDDASMAGITATL